MPTYNNDKIIGAQVKGPIEAVSDADYPQGESFEMSTKPVSNLGVK
jgi:hypothetical protein